MCDISSSYIAPSPVLSHSLAFAEGGRSRGMTRNGDTSQDVEVLLHTERSFLLEELPALLSPLWPVLNQRKSKFPGTASLLRANVQSPKQGSNKHEVFIFSLLPLNSIGNNPYDKPVPIDLHNHRLSWLAMIPVSSVSSLSSL